MHECYFRDASSEWAQKTGHTWTSRMVEVASGSKPKKLLLTHINPLETVDDPVDIAAVRAGLDCEVVMAVDELTVEF